ncbi:hypothetical protein CBM2629_B140047 [Cupriavidus taiwanensis]|nr:hypothetical protein CBM2629_B140047 [Cupriavidus taiwanensis]
MGSIRSERCNVSLSAHNDDSQRATRGRPPSKYVLRPEAVIREADSGTSCHSESYPYNDGEEIMASKMTSQT